jgi:hypothetical protein
MKKAQIRAKPSLKHARTAACCAAILILWGCATTPATGPAYGPQASEKGAGYADQQISATRYRVSYSGDNQTTRGQVEDYLLRRAAEITVQSGYNYFAFDNRSLETDTNLYRTNDNWDPMSGLAFGLGRRYPGRAEHFAKGSKPAFWSEKEAVPITRYTARSDVVLLPSDQLAMHPDALAAREVLRYFSPEFVSATGTPSVKANP